MIVSEEGGIGPTDLGGLALESHFDAVFAARLALREKQIQQSYRPIIGIHKWFARRPGTLLRNLLLAEFKGADPLGRDFWQAHELRGVIADPFMGGGTSVFEATRLGFNVVGTDINPMAWWVVRQSITRLDLDSFAACAEQVATRVEDRVGRSYVTRCEHCDNDVPVKYWLWVKTQNCPDCGSANDLFPGYLLAEAVRHPRHVVACATCGVLNEYATPPTLERPGACVGCGGAVHVEGPAGRQKTTCRSCRSLFSYPPTPLAGPPKHRMWAIEYHCEHCRPNHQGRFFKRPDPADLARYEASGELLASSSADLPIPDDEVPAGDETDRLRRWGYKRYRDMFNDRQLLGLGSLLGEIGAVEDRDIRHALLTVFSDFIRYQNMLCRYDTYALKCQDIFSVHGFPVGLLQCEDALIGTPRVGSGSFRHFVEKYLRAKRYALAPFETRFVAGRKQVVPITGETIAAELVDAFPSEGSRRAWVRASSAEMGPELPAQSLDGVFTDPPYFDNVQYAELMDFCYVWLRLGLQREFAEFAPPSTRHAQELTGNATGRRGLEHFTDGLSKVFRLYARALKTDAPFVFTFHHNDPAAYAPLVVAILDAGLSCTTVLPAAGEMAASLHIQGTGSSILDSVFVCRAGHRELRTEDVSSALMHDAELMTSAGVGTSVGDLRCLAAGRVARNVVNSLRESWDADLPLATRMEAARTGLLEEALKFDLESLVGGILRQHGRKPAPPRKAVAATV
jgi:RNase P subunit RPR2